MLAENPPLIEDVLQALTPEQRAGQLLVANYRDPVVPQDVYDLLRGLAGMLLFGENITQPEQTLALTESFQAVAPTIETRSGAYRLGMLAAIDQEGGTVSRLIPPATIMPAAMSTGATRSTELAYEAASITARELRAMGINVNLAPDLDVNNNPQNPVIGVRSFSDWPELVAEMGIATIRGLQDNRVAATGKHFPGHGDTSIDTHLDLPRITHHRERLSQVELVPFAAAIRAGVELIMTSHIIFPAFEPSELPATLSTEVLTGLLRKRLGFTNVITTDALNMKAISDRYGLPEASVQAIQAGVDLLMPVTTPQLLREIYEALVDAAQTGRISRERLDASARRVLRLKQRLGLIVPPGQSFDPDRLPVSAVGSEEHQNAARRIALAGVTPVRVQPGTLPLPRTDLAVLDFRFFRHTGAEDVRKPVDRLAAAIHTYAPQAEVVPFDMRMQMPTGDEIAQAYAAVDRCAALLIVSRSAGMIPGQAELIRRCVQRARERAIPVVLLMARSPYDALAFPEIGTVFAIYSDVPASLEMGAAALFGEAEPGGHMPITLPVILNES